MSKICQLTGKKGMVGNRVSHAMNRTKRRFEPNLKKKRFYLPDEDRWVTLKVSTSSIRTADKKGVDHLIKEAVKRGFLKK